MSELGHSHGAGANTRALITAIALTGTYLVAEIVGGILTSSLALLSDAAHMLTDVMALVIALLAMKMGQRPADRKRTFGYYRFEILAAAGNAAVLFLVAFYIMSEAWVRFQAPPAVQSIPMLIVASIGLVVNLASMRVLKTGSGHSLNVKGAYLEVWSDLLGSIAVIVAALIIRFTGWWQADPLLAVLLGLWVLPRTWKLISESVNVLLEGVPEGLQLAAVEERLRSIAGVKGIHDLHVWAITSGKNSLTAHFVLEPDRNQEEVLRQASTMLEHEFGITHTTVQIEAMRCDAGEQGCNLANEHIRGKRK